MNFLNLAKERYSARKFDSRKIAEEKINLILESGRIAPTATNAQPQRIYVLNSEEALAKINEITPYAFHAPLVLLICAEKSEAWVNPYTKHNAAEMDVSIVTTHMMLEAKDLGIDSCWVCYFDADKVRKEFNIPENLEIYCMMPMGYVLEGTEPNQRHFDRKPIAQTVKWL